MVAPAYVPVLNADGRPLSPCHPARARQLLHRSKARIVSRLPFVIQLIRHVEHPVFAPVTVALDDGKTVGVAVVEHLPHRDRVVCLVTFTTRGERISDQLKARRAIRNARRNRRNRRRHQAGASKIFYRKPVPYPPSIRADVQAKLNVVDRLRRWYPITDIQIEIVKLNIQRKVYGTAPQRRKRPGPQSVLQGVAPSAQKRLAILQRDGFRCLYCGTPVSTDTAHVHHFVQRKHGGSARYDIQGTLCSHCHTAVTTQALALCFDTTAYPNVRAAGRAMHGRRLLEARLYQWGLPVTVRYGYETAALREAFGVDKTHANDAMVLACRPNVPRIDVAAEYTVKLHARHDGRKLFDVNPGAAAYRSAAARQPGVDPTRMVVDDHDQATNVANRSYRRHVRQRYYHRLRAHAGFNPELLPGSRHLNKICTTNRAVWLSPNGPVALKNPRIAAWRLNAPWPSRFRLLERRDIVHVDGQGLGIITAIKSNATVRIDFFTRQPGRKTAYGSYAPARVHLVQKGSSQTWIPTPSSAASSPA